MGGEWRDNGANSQQSTADSKEGGLTTVGSRAPNWYSAVVNHNQVNPLPHPLSSVQSAQAIEKRGDDEKPVRYLQRNVEPRVRGLQKMQALGRRKYAVYGTGTMICWLAATV